MKDEWSGLEKAVVEAVERAKLNPADDPTLMERLKKALQVPLPPRQVIPAEEIARFIKESYFWRDGFDYKAAIHKLKSAGLSYSTIAKIVGSTKGTVSKIRSGPQEPGHKHGEALYILYWEAFREKPPYKKTIIQKFPKRNIS